MPRSAETPPGKKKCSYCGEVKPNSEFCFDTRTRDGLRCACTPCAAKQNKASKARAQLRHYEEQYQHLLTQHDHPGYIFRSRDMPDRNGQRCQAVMFTRFNKLVVQFEDGQKLVTTQVHLRRIQEKEN